MSIKVGVLGTGNVARNNYLPFLSRQEDVSLVYHSRTRSRAEACAQEFGGRVVSSVAELLAEEPDTVLVLTHETQRYQATMVLLEAGRPKRLFFEKPLVAEKGQANVSEGDFGKARELLKRAAEVGAETAMVFNYRFFDQTMRGLEILAQRRGVGLLPGGALVLERGPQPRVLSGIDAEVGRSLGLVDEETMGDLVELARSHRQRPGRGTGGLGVRTATATEDQQGGARSEASEDSASGELGGGRGHPGCVAQCRVHVKVTSTNHTSSVPVSLAASSDMA